MAERRQELCTSNGAVKISRRKRYRLGIENVSLKELGIENCSHILTLLRIANEKYYIFMK